MVGVRIIRHVLDGDFNVLLLLIPTFASVTLIAPFASSNRAPFVYELYALSVGCPVMVWCVCDVLTVLQCLCCTPTRRISFPRHGPKATECCFLKSVIYSKASKSQKKPNRSLLVLSQIDPTSHILARLVPPKAVSSSRAAYRWTFSYSDSRSNAK